MKFSRWAATALVFAIAACGAPYTQPPASVTEAERTDSENAIEPLKEGFPFDMQAYPDDNTYRLQAVEELPITNVTADSTLPGLPVTRMVDGDLATSWVNEPYRAPTSWAAFQLASNTTIASVGIKTGVSPAGTSYDVQTSSDGVNWTTRLSNQTNTSWGVETKTLPAGTTGQYVRIFWRNSTSAPVPHFAIYELYVNGETGTTPTPTPTPSTGATPTPSPSASASPTPAPGTPVRVTPIGSTASSTYAGLPTTRAHDGNTSTQWSSGTYKSPEESLTLQFASSVNFSQMKIKTGALPGGITYKTEVSQDGVTWEPGSGRLTNITWGMETQDIGGTGKFLRIRFFNSETEPLARFNIFEVEVYGGGTGGPTAAPSSSPSVSPSGSPSSSPSPTPSPTSAEAWYPDWIAVATQSYFVDKTGGRMKLRFSTGIANIGPGHVQLKHQNGIAVQEVLNGENQVIARKNTTRLIYFEPHGHYHVENIARYTLRSGTLDGPIVRNSIKTSFCVEDSMKFRATSEAARYPDCSVSSSGLTRNYVDIYTTNLPGQDFDVTELPKGTYYLVVEMDPGLNFLDYNRNNNVAWSRFSIDPAAGTATRTGTN